LAKFNYINPKYQISHEFANYIKSKTKQLNKYVLFQLIINLLSEMYYSIRCYRIIYRHILWRYIRNYKYIYISRLFITRFFFGIIHHIYLYINHIKKVPRRARRRLFMSTLNKSPNLKRFMRLQRLNKHVLIRNKTYVLFIKFLFLLFLKCRSFIRSNYSNKNIMYHTRRISNFLFYQKHIDILSNIDETVLSYDLRKRLIDAIFTVGRRSRRRRFLNKKKILHSITLNIYLTTNRFDLFKRQRRYRTFYYYKLKFRQLYKSVYNIRTTTIFNKYIKYISTRLINYSTMEEVHLYQVYFFLYSYFYFFLGTSNPTTLLGEFNLRINGIKRYLNNFHYFIIGDRIEIHSIPLLLIKMVRKLCLSFTLSQLFYTCITPLAKLLIHKISYAQKLVRSKAFSDHNLTPIDTNMMVKLDQKDICKYYNSLQLVINTLLMHNFNIDRHIPVVKKKKYIYKYKLKNNHIVQALFNMPRYTSRRRIKSRSVLKLPSVNIYKIKSVPTFNMFTRKTYDGFTIFKILLYLYRYYDSKISQKLNKNIHYHLLSYSISRLSMMHFKFVNNSDTFFDSNFLELQLCSSRFKNWTNSIKFNRFYNINSKVLDYSFHKYWMYHKRLVKSISTAAMSSNMSVNVHPKIYNKAIRKMNNIFNRKVVNTNYKLLFNKFRNKKRKYFILRIIPILCFFMNYCSILFIPTILQFCKNIQNVLLIKVLSTQYAIVKMHYKNRLFFSVHNYVLENVNLLRSIVMLVKTRDKMLFKIKSNILYKKYKFIYKKRKFKYSKRSKYLNIYIGNTKTALPVFLKFFIYKKRKYKKFLTYKRHLVFLSKFFNMQNKYYLKSYEQNYAYTNKYNKYNKKFHLRFHRKKPRFHYISKLHTYIRKIYFRLIGPIISHSKRKSIMNIGFIKAIYSTMYSMWIRRMMAGKYISIYRRKSMVAKLIKLVSTTTVHKKKNKHYIKYLDRHKLKQPKLHYGYSRLILNIQNKFFNMPLKKVFKKVLNQHAYVYLKSFTNMYTYINYIYHARNTNILPFINTNNLQKHYNNAIYTHGTDSTFTYNWPLKQIIDVLNVHQAYTKNIYKYFNVVPMIYTSNNTNFKFIVYNTYKSSILQNLNSKIPSKVRHFLKANNYPMLNPRFR